MSAINTTKGCHSTTESVTILLLHVKYANNKQDRMHSWCSHLYKNMNQSYISSRK